MHEVKILKEIGKGLGVLITSRSSPDGQSCVVIDSIDKDGPAHIDGRLKKGENINMVSTCSVGMIKAGCHTPGIFQVFE